ncbi:MAG: hypothetical protein R8N24_02835 [Alphaproteobacteria bacterium]|nr:hypothetical protein [Alphaproteobacteria bacterium]
MKRTYISLFCSMAAVLPSASIAGIRVGNATRAYQQMNQMRYEAENYNNAAAATTLPINVTDANLAQQLQSGNTSSGVTVDMLDNCAMIYPNGVFEWARPTAGTKRNSAPMCTAVVELRAYQAAQDGSDLVVARVNLAAGDAVKCNISAFPAMSHLQAAGNVTFPSDREPTVEDVIEVMNEEQKQNAVLKILGGAIIGGFGGNLTGKNDAGKDSMLGTDKDKMKNTAIGAIGGAALMAGSTYSGKVAGDMILSTGINAAAGSVVGNVVASGDSVLRIENCTVGGVTQTCLWGYYRETGQQADDKTAYVSQTNIRSFKLCKDGDENAKCENANLTGVKIDDYKDVTNVGTNTAMDLEDMFKDKFSRVSENNKYCYTKGKMEQRGYDDCGDGEMYIKLDEYSIITNRKPAMLVGVKDKGFGYKKTDWDKNKSNYNNYTIVGRSGKGEAASLNVKGPDSKYQDSFAFNGDNFEPMYLDAEDGGIIDMDNKARLTSTLTGAGVGGAMGAFSAYQGAQDEITQRWLAEVQAYKDSLNKFYCATGNRFLSRYNDETVIPLMTE